MQRLLALLALSASLVCADEPEFANYTTAFPDGVEVLNNGTKSGLNGLPFQQWDRINTWVNALIPKACADIANENNVKNDFCSLGDIEVHEIFYPDVRVESSSRTKCSKSLILLSVPCPAWCVAARTAQ